MKKTSEISLNSPRWINIETRPMIFSQKGNQTKVDWRELHFLLAERDRFALRQIRDYLAFNGVSIAPSQYDFFWYILHTGSHIFKKQTEFSLQKITPRQLGFVKNLKTGKGVPTFDEFIFRAVERGFILCHFYIPLLYCLGTNFRALNDSEGYRFVTPLFRGGHRFELIKYEEKYILDAIKIDHKSLVHLDYPHIFLRPNSLQRKKFEESHYCHEHFPQISKPQYTEPKINNG